MYKRCLTFLSEVDRSKLCSTEFPEETLSLQRRAERFSRSEGRTTGPHHRGYSSNMQFGRPTEQATPTHSYGAFSSQDERTPGKEEEIGKDGPVWTVVGEEGGRGRRQGQNALTDRQIQDAQTAFLCLVDAEMLIHVQGCRVAEFAEF
ncbi:hypothetical protein CRENBAI_009320 [Crenichthys baileyi]|uniref:Uncharacterized protein n=1 Tax=Crenichthys baileyi TaxID=28760 RepID=A0AAV9SEC2_9TELE